MNARIGCSWAAAGGRTAAVLSSLIATLKKLGVDPFDYLRDIRGNS